MQGGLEVEKISGVMPPPSSLSHFVLSRSIEGLQKKTCIQLEFSASKNCFEAAGEAGNEIL